MVGLVGVAVAVVGVVILATGNIMGMLVAVIGLALTLLDDS